MLRMNFSDFSQSSNTHQLFAISSNSNQFSYKRTHKAINSNSVWYSASKRTFSIVPWTNKWLTKPLHVKLFAPKAQRSQLNFLIGYIPSVGFNLGHGTSYIDASIFIHKGLEYSVYISPWWLLIFFASQSQWIFLIYQIFCVHSF